MPITATAQGKKFTFPDGTSPEQMGGAIDEFFAQQPAKTEQPQEAFNLEQFQPAGGPAGQEVAEPKPSAIETTRALAAEFASGVNRPIFQLIDAFGTDTVNAALNLAGSERQIPGAMETFGAKKGAFAGEGLATDIAAGAGELATLATGTGALLRAGAGALPAVKAGESALLGTTRQLGKSTPLQDVRGGLASGGGQEVGQEFGGEEGALFGGVVAPLALSVPLLAAKETTSKLLKQAAPSLDQLKQTARGIYQSIDDSGIVIPADDFDVLANSILKSVTTGSGRHVPDLTPRANAIIRTFDEGKGQPKSLSDIDDLRQIAREVGDSPVGRERRLSGITVDKIDDFLNGLTGKVGDKEAGEAFKSARDLWQRVKKVETLDAAVVDAQSQASGFENGLRTQFRAIAKKINRGKLKGFTAEEKEAIEKVSQGTTAGNIARFLGKFGIMDGVTSRTLTTLGGAGLAGASTGSGVAAVAVPGIGQISSALAQRMTARNAAMASSIIRAGKNSNKITEVYMKNTPKDQRSSTELAELLIANQVPLDGINIKSVRHIIADAAIIASIARFNDEKEAEKP